MSEMKESKNQSSLHAFVICAYGESPFLDNCVKSLLRQSVRSEIVIATSTPNELICEMARKYQLRLCINNGEKGLAGDWNFALAQSDAQLITLAHQDDIYMPQYTESILSAFKISKRPIILFTDYYELRSEETVTINTLLKVKRALLYPLRCRRLWKSRFVRRRILSLGSPICCPSVTLVRSEITQPLFKNNMRSNIDWQAWEELSKQKGSFVYVPRALMKHRIHEGSTTSELLAQSARRQEDLFMYCKFWPKPIAEIIEFFYCRNEKSNRLDE